MKKCIEKVGENSIDIHQIRSVCKATRLAEMLRVRFDRQSEIKDLNESISVFENAASAEFH